MKTRISPRSLSIAMKSFRIFAAIMAVSAAVCAFAPVKSVSGEFRRRYSTTLRNTIPWKEPLPVTVTEKSGGIYVKCEKRETVDIKGIGTCFSPDLNDARMCSPELSLNIENRNDSLSISTSMPQAMKSGMAAHIDYALTVPTDIPLTLVSDSGEITVKSASGPVSVNTSSGNVSLFSLTGVATASTVTGSISAFASPGLRQVNTVTGDVEISIGRLNGNVLDISTISGTVRVTVDDDVDAVIEATALSGRIDTEKSKGEIVKSTPRHVVVQCGDGGEKKIVIRTLTGTVKIVSPEAQRRKRWP